MADDSISKKVLIDVQIAVDDAVQAITALKASLSDLNGAVINSKVSIDNAKAAQAQLTVELTKGKVEQQNIKTAIDRARLAQIEANNATKEAKKNMVAASGSYAEAAQKLAALGKAIKNTEGGFTSQNKAIQAQIAQYNKLNSQLKAFDAQMGNHQRNVGGYEEALGGLTGILGKLIPGFSQFQSILKDASNGFSAMGKGATETAEGMEGAEVAAGGLSIAAGAVATAFLVVTAAVIGTITYLSQFQNYADRFQKTKAGIVAQLNQIGQSFANLDFSNFFGKIKDAGDQASYAAGQLQMMGRDAQNAVTLTDNENAQLGVMMKKFRDRATSATEASKIHGDALKILNGQYDRNNELAVNAYNAMLQQELAGKGFSDAQINSLRIQSGEVAGLKTNYEQLTNIATNFVEETQGNGAQAGKDFLEKLNQGMQGVIATNSQLQNQKQLFDNRDDAKQAKAEAAAEKQLQLQQEIQRQIDQIKSDSIASISKTLQFQMSALGKELDAIDESYRQKIFKLQEFISKQKAILENPKNNAKTKGLAQNAITKATGLKSQLGDEKDSDIQKVIEDNADKQVRAMNESAIKLREAQAQNISESHERELALLKTGEEEKNNVYYNAAYERQQEIDKLDDDLLNKDGKYNAKELGILKINQDNLKNEQIKSDSEQVEEHQKYLKQISNTNKKYAMQGKLLDDQLASNKASRKTGFSGGDDNPFNRDLENADIATAQDNTQNQLQDAGLDNKDNKNDDGSAYSANQLKQKQVIQEAGEKTKRDITKKYAKQRLDIEVDAAKQFADEALQIAQQAAQRNYENAITSIEKQKNYELQNQALTTTQKYAINERARVQEGQAKVKEFHQEQEIAIIKGVIDTASAVIKASPNPVLMALAAVTGALEIGVIASQKAPAYAKGGIHYDSDGKGGVLPGYSKTDNMNARLRSGEGIVVSEAMRDPWAKSVVSAINQSYGGRSFDSTASVSWRNPGFASGGIYQTYMPTGDNGLRPNININSTTRLHPDDINGIASAVSNINFPPIDVKDINYQQGKLAQTTDRLSY